MKRLLVSFVIVTSACSSDLAVAENALQPFSVSEAREAVVQSGIKPSQVRIWAVCGPSIGHGLYSGSSLTKFEDDAISNGRLIFFSGADRSGANLVYKDATGNFTNSLQDGASVRMFWTDGNGSTSMWSIEYAETGVIETHNIFSSEGQVVDFWTSNKPSTLLGDPSVRAYYSQCHSL